MHNLIKGIIWKCPNYHRHIKLDIISIWHSVLVCLLTPDFGKNMVNICLLLYCVNNEISVTKQKNLVVTGIFLCVTVCVGHLNKKGGQSPLPFKTVTKCSSNKKSSYTLKLTASDDHLCQ